VKSIVIYYSQSGNTKKMAQAIHEGMSQAGERVNIARLQDVDPRRDLAGYDLIGLGSPVHRHKELPNVTQFIDSMQSVEGKHGFSFCTHGALPGYYVARTVAAMQQRGLTAIGWKNWFTSVFFPVTPKPYFTDGHPDEIDLKEGQDFGREMVQNSRRISQGETQLIPVLPMGKEYEDLYEVVPVPSQEDYKAGKDCEANMQVKVNPERCNFPKCTFCVDNCPMHCIDFDRYTPATAPTCAKCWLCEQTCPRGAIEVDWAPFQKHHDPMTVNWLGKSLEVFEAQGRFRRLVPPDQVGWDTPTWTYKKPRFKIP